MMGTEILKFRIQIAACDVSKRGSTFDPIQTRSLTVKFGLRCNFLDLFSCSLKNEDLMRANYTMTKIVKSDN